MQTENLKLCGIASCDVNNPFLTFACWFCISNGNGFSALRVKGCPQWQISYFGRRTFLKWDSREGSVLGRCKGTMLTGQLARLPDARWNFFLASMAIWFLLLFRLWLLTSFFFLVSLWKLYSSYPHCCFSQLGYKIQQISLFYMKTP